ncbi:hypothetical protein PLICRDRAFT_168445 [Plicaturopsis crispa FD-325 SS-3]|uniref:ClpP/crotonase n=1 Tax=Plicaturopsis crispa FD-325 SS-3 TaxID=944288 RepID=A0A0C9T716_PLICR|nr:hypothetical protein PLICRDRAFT_168445 [Plicaturopsis crispa FD-325 SS-3]
MSNFSTEFVKVTEPVPHVLLVELARAPVNAFNEAFWTQYGQVFDNISASTNDVRAIVLASALPKIFASGIDLTALDHINNLHPEPARRAFELRSHVKAFQNSIAAPERCPIPVIVAVNGPVYGLGVDIISACDVRYASSDATFAIKEVDVGLAADIGSLAHLPKITGNTSLLRELALSARTFSVVEAEKLGLVSKVVDGGRDAVVKEALSLAKLIASKSPVAVLGTKHLLMHARDHSVAENMDYTVAWNAAMLQTGDLSASFKALTAKPKRQPQYEGLKLPAKL